jgi:hypothetical protein
VSGPGSRRERGEARHAGEAARVVVALLIALTSILGAGVAWRASKASIAAEELEREAFRQKVENVAARAKVRETPEKALMAYTQWLDATSRARTLAAGGPLARLDAAASRRSAAREWQSVPLNARSAAGKLDLDRAARVADVEIMLGEVQLGARAGHRPDLDPRPEVRKATHLRTKENRLAGLAALLVVAAVFFAVAQILRTRMFRVPLAAGAVVLVVAFALALYVDLAT